ncbi:hypothetical protein BD413DRAFT_615645 [Trametes elegans]|nr:hypothetical protein BD413DRAFT_615645 [Trametes elegans]
MPRSCDDFCMVASAIVPLIKLCDPAITAPVLNHPNLTLGNVIIPPEGPARIESIIDWQGATVDPHYTQPRLPTGLIYTDGLVAIEGGFPQWPANCEELTRGEQKVIRIYHRCACRQVYYSERQMYPLKPRGKVWRWIYHIHELDSLRSYILRCVADGPHDLQGSLVTFQRRWDEITGDPCPVDFTPQEIAAYEAKEKNHAEDMANTNRLRVQVGIMEDGSVPTEAYDGLKQALEQCRKGWDEPAMKGPFPFCESGYSQYLS